MKPCRDCQKQISEQAFACPNCGAPFPGHEPLSSPSWWRPLLAAALALAAFAGYFAHVMVEAYLGTLSGSGRHLSSPTADILCFSPALVALAPLIVLGVWRLWPKPKERGIAALVAAVALFVVLPTLASKIVWSIASP
jgi:H+/Cl- antiporter ClcA